MGRRGRHRLVLALVLSLVLHALGLLTLRMPEGGAVVSDPAPIEVALLRAEPPSEAAPARQFVAPPDEVNDRPPERTRLESDRDTTVLEETVRPGVPKPVPPPAPAAATRPRVPQRQAARATEPTVDSDPAAAERGGMPALASLFASPEELVRAQEAMEAARAAAAPGHEHGRQRVALAVAPVAPEWTLPGTRGTLDHLPDIQRGDVTLLNTKANVFAPFVRRVGERVFQHLIIRQHGLALPQILSARGPVRMRVLLDPKGALRSVKVEDHSGSASMDDTLLAALTTAAFDNNPPPTAANADGNYEFVFQAQLRAYSPGEGGLPGRIESRLSVGLL